MYERGPLGHSRPRIWERLLVAACRCILSTVVLRHFKDTSSNPHVDGITHTRLPGRLRSQRVGTSMFTRWSVLSKLQSAPVGQQPDEEKHYSGLCRR